MKFEWDDKKQAINIEKHGVSFFDAQLAFTDLKHVIADDIEHSQNERCYYCFGLVHGSVATVRFTKRGDIIRIIGAGYWREGKEAYEKENSL